MVNEEKGKVELRIEFDDNAIKWASRVGVSDPDIAKVLYWCVVNVYDIRTKCNKLEKSLEKLNGDILLWQECYGKEPDKK